MIASIISAFDTEAIFLSNPPISSTSTYLFLILFLIQFMRAVINIFNKVVTNDIVTDPTVPLIIVDIISLLLFDPSIYKINI